MCTVEPFSLQVLTFTHTHTVLKVLVGCRKEGLLPLEEVIRDYVRLAVDCDNNTSNTKYCVAQMLQSAVESAPGKALIAAANMREIW